MHVKHICLHAKGTIESTKDVSQDADSRSYGIAA